MDPRKVKVRTYPAIPKKASTFLVGGGLHILDEEVLTTAVASRHLNSIVADARFTPLVVWRWMTGGVVADDGERIYLEHARLGRRLVTSRQALGRFSERLTKRKDCPAADGTHVVDAARRQLKGDGFFS